MSKGQISDFRDPRYTSPEVLRITLLKPEVLQTWVNREVLGARNTGRGKRRLYSTLDVVKLAIMRRMADLQVALATSVEIADGAAAKLDDKGTFDWNFYIVLRPHVATDTMNVSVTSSGEPLAKYHAFQGDPYNVRLSTIVEWFDGLFCRRKKHGLAAAYQAKVPADEQDNRPIMDEARTALARQGIHAEPAIVFPLGEIVNGTLAQLAVIDVTSAR